MPSDVVRKRWEAGCKLPIALYGDDIRKVDPLSIIRRLEYVNPKQGRPKRRYALYEDGMTIEKYVAAVAKFGDAEGVAYDDLAWDQNHLFIRVDPPVQNKAWSVADAKAKLSEVLRRARAGEPQTIGTEDACVVVSAADFARYWRPRSLGRFLVESAPRGKALELPSRAEDRGDPFADGAGERAA